MDLRVEYVEIIPGPGDSLLSPDLVDWLWEHGCCLMVRMTYDELREKFPCSADSATEQQK